MSAAVLSSVPTETMENELQLHAMWKQSLIIPGVILQGWKFLRRMTKRLELSQRNAKRARVHSPGREAREPAR
ncbi:hypothetical protein UY3_04944 [Chelonia mydas]|uniref:Uncharacterized protein n=1 Tax=Chelonia mydas TaxID=8469 RepID=M7BKZ8_CHEMY|nr:hypothetical protein UY3_04944 [Chelonia mydas]